MKYILPLLLAIFFNACSVKYNTETMAQIGTSSENKKIYNLQKAIENLSHDVNKKEAQTIAEISVLYSLELANRYELVFPPLFHNTLINMNVKERGLCYHFAQDLIKELKKQNLQTLELRWAVHDKKKYFEHSSVVVTAKNMSFEEGIVLDAWRDSGKLYWNYLKNDTRYNWKEDIKDSKYYGTVK